MQLKEDIDALIAETLFQLKHLEDENTQLLTNYKTELRRKLAELKNQLTHCKETLQNGTDIKVFDVTSRLNTNNTLPRRPVLGTAKFSQNKNPYELLTSALGKMTLTLSGQSDGHAFAEVDKSAGSSLSQLTRPSDQTPCEMTHSSDFPTALPMISVLSEWTTQYDIIHICPACDSGAWICEANKTLTQLTSEGTVKQQIKSPVKVTNTCMSPSTQKVWVCSDEDNSVMELKTSKWLPSSSLVRKFNTKDKPLCLCVTKDGHVLVGMKHGIIKYTQKGKPSLMTTSQSKKPQVRSPWTISECPVSENVAVLDRDLSFHGDEDGSFIIVMDKHLHALYRYGTHQHNVRTGSQTFDPWDVTYDRLGHLVVADYNNDCLHLLCGDGQYLGLLYAEIGSPQAVCVDRQGVLWVAFCDELGADQVKRLQHTSD